MPAPDNTFRAVGTGDATMHGAPALMLAGYTPEEQDAVRTLLDTHGLHQIPVTVLARGDGDTVLAKLSQRPDKTNFGETANLPRTAIASGLTERDFHVLLDAYRHAQLPRPMWAALTPTSEQWSARALLTELLEERRAMQQAAQPKNDQQN
jgi:hypothetical protein